MATTVARADAPLYAGAVGVQAIDGVVVLDPAPPDCALLAERDRGTPIPLLAAGFHEAIGRASAAVAVDIARRRNIDAVVLTGGVFQNARLSEIVATALVDEGIDVLAHT